MSTSPAVPSTAAPATVELTDLERRLIDAMLELYYGLPQEPPRVADGELGLIVVPTKPRRAKSQTEKSKRVAMQTQAA